MLIFRFGVCRVCGNRAGGNCLKMNFRNFVPITFDLKNILANRVFTYCFIIPYQYPVGENIYPSDGVKYSKAPLSGSLWAIPPMVPSGFIPMESLPPHPIPPLHTS